MIHSTNSHGPVMSRRSVLGVAAAGLGTMALAGCGGWGGNPETTHNHQRT